MNRRSECARTFSEQSTRYANAVQLPYQTMKKFERPQSSRRTPGEVHPTMKSKRKICNERFRALVDQMYREA